MDDEILHWVECDCEVCREKWAKVENIAKIPEPKNNKTIFEMIEMAKNSEYGGIWYSEKGPIQITKDGQLLPLPPDKFMVAR